MNLLVDANPLRMGLPHERAVDPCVFVIFGGTGDLAHRKLLPALYHLFLAGLLPRGFAILSYASPDLTSEQYRESIRQSIAKTSPYLSTRGRVWDSFAETMFYMRRTDDLIASLTTLKQRLTDTDSGRSTGGNYLFYLAIPPFVFADTAKGLGAVGLAQDESGKGWRRIVVEKPFGEDLKSARDLNTALQGAFREDQIYRIDHYLGKETVQNILVFRFANQFVEPLLNASLVDSIQITMAETIGVEKRGEYYDKTGALRDIIQNHILQLLALICMEPPSSLAPEATRDEKTKVLRSVRKIDPSQVNEVAVRAQYSAGKLMGKEVPGYRQEDHVAVDSVTETYVGLKLFVDNWRWEGVPIYVRTGKRLAKRVTEIALQLKAIPHVLFGRTHRDELRPNIFALNIQPDEGTTVRFEAKVPGLGYRIQPVRMEFRYGSAFGPSVPDAYERLLLDAMLGDPSLFARADGVEAAWEICDPILDGWRITNAPAYSYIPGSWGPKEAVGLIERDGRKWRRL